MSNNSVDFSLLWNLICSEVQHHDISPYLMQELFINDDDLEKIFDKETNEEKMNLLLHSLQNKGLDVVLILLRALKQASPLYDHIIILLNKSSATLTNGDEKDIPNIREQSLDSNLINIVKDNMHVQKRWRSLANRLSMTKEANFLQREANIYMYTPSEIIVNLLEQWKDIKGNKSTCGALYDALRAESFNEICDEIINKYSFN